MLVPSWVVLIHAWVLCFVVPVSYTSSILHTSVFHTDGQAIAGLGDIAIGKFDLLNGTRIWTRQFGGLRTDYDSVAQMNLAAHPTETHRMAVIGKVPSGSYSNGQPLWNGMTMLFQSWWLTTQLCYTVAPGWYCDSPPDSIRALKMSVRSLHSLSHVRPLRFRTAPVLVRSLFPVRSVITVMYRTEWARFVHPPLPV